MKVRVRIPEFTWRDEKGYHTVAHVGEVPADHPVIKDALAKGYLEEMGTVPSQGPVRLPGTVPTSDNARKSTKKEA